MRYANGELETQVLAAIAKKPVSAIFEQLGEACFGELETQVLAELSVDTPSVVATGGGIIQEKRNWDYLNHDRTVWLNVDLEILKTRVAEDATRPLADNLESLLETRRPLYDKAKLTITVEAEQSPEELADQIIAMIPNL